MHRVTLDTNAIIHLEEKRPAAASIIRLIDLHKRGVITLCVCAISGSERSKGGGFPPTFEVFKRKLSQVGLGDTEILAPIGYWNLIYFDFCLWADNELVDLEKRIHRVLFPEIAFVLQDHLGETVGKGRDVRERRWRNDKCDVLALWSHIHHGCSVFVTSDENYHATTKKDRLKELGAGEILRPVEAVEFLNSDRGRERS